MLFFKASIRNTVGNEIFKRFLFCFIEKLLFYVRQRGHDTREETQDLSSPCDIFLTFHK